jgi:hypothetical protein
MLFITDEVGYLFVRDRRDRTHFLFADFTMNSVTDEAGSFSSKTGEALVYYMAILATIYT